MVTSLVVSTTSPSLQLNSSRALTFFAQVKSQKFQTSFMMEWELLFGTVRMGITSNHSGITSTIYSNENIIEDIFGVLQSFRTAQRLLLQVLMSMNLEVRLSAHWLKAGRWTEIQSSPCCHFCQGLPQLLRLPPLFKRRLSSPLPQVIAFLVHGSSRTDSYINVQLLQLKVASAEIVRSATDSIGTDAIFLAESAFNRMKRYIWSNTIIQDGQDAPPAGVNVNDLPGK
jgi:hypothetical protein